MSNTRNRKKQINNFYENLQSVKDALGDTSDGLKNKAAEMVDDLLESVSNLRTDYEDSVVEYITSQPLKSLGIALLSGLFIGKVIL